MEKNKSVNPSPKIDRLLFATRGGKTLIAVIENICQNDKRNNSKMKQKR